MMFLVGFLFLAGRQVGAYLRSVRGDSLIGRPVSPFGINWPVIFGGQMGNWEPIFWIIGGSLGYFALLMLVGFLKKSKKRQ
jgi:hypothetical protein